MLNEPKILLRKVGEAMVFSCYFLFFFNFRRYRIFSSCLLTLSARLHECIHPTAVLAEASFD